jgi:hypothetical protein
MGSVDGKVVVVTGATGSAARGVDTRGAPAPKEARRADR